MDGADGGRGGMIPPPFFVLNVVKDSGWSVGRSSKARTGEREKERASKRAKATRANMRRSDARCMIMAGLNTCES